MRSLALALALLLATPARAAELVISTGVKLAYTFGEGFTYGAEVSLIRLPDTSACEGCDAGERLEAIAGDLSKIWGVVFNADRVWGGSINKLRAGGQWTGPAVGLEAGPALVFTDEGTHFGFSITPWVGYTTIPFYTYTLVFGREDNLHELGSYFKLALCATCESSGNGDSDLD